MNKLFRTITVPAIAALALAASPANAGGLKDLLEDLLPPPPHEVLNKVLGNDHKQERHQDHRNNERDSHRDNRRDARHDRHDRHDNRHDRRDNRHDRRDNRHDRRDARHDRRHDNDRSHGWRNDRPRDTWNGNRHDRRGHDKHHRGHARDQRRADRHHGQRHATSHYRSYYNTAYHRRHYSRCDYNRPHHHDRRGKLVVGVYLSSGLSFNGGNGGLSFSYRH